MLCSVVVAELHYGARRSTRQAETLVQVQAFCNHFFSVVFDDESAAVYGRIRADLAELGTLIGPNDLLIAAIAQANNLTLITRNTREFSRVAGLKLEDWQ